MHYAVVIGPGYFCTAKVRFITLGFVVIVQVKVCLRCVVIVFLLSKRKISLIYISLFTVSKLLVKSSKSFTVFS